MLDNFDTEGIEGIEGIERIEGIEGIEGSVDTARFDLGRSDREHMADNFRTADILGCVGTLHIVVAAAYIFRSSVLSLHSALSFVQTPIRALPPRTC